MAESAAPTRFGGIEPRELLWVLLGVAFTAAVVVLGLAGASEPIVFGSAAVTLVLLAWLLGHATEQLGHRVGGRVAGMLNATLGNLPELVVVLLLVHEAKEHPQLMDVAKASILGSVLGNVLFVMGLAFLVGGIKYGTQHFQRTFASLQSTMLLLAVAAISVPTLIEARLGSSEGSEHIQGISIAAAIVLFFVYIMSMKFFSTDTEHSAVDHGKTTWTTGAAIGMLAVSAIGVGVVSEALVGSMEATIAQVGISEAFMGFILVPVVGNIAEHLVAVQLARRNEMDFSMTIALGSSVQVALGLVPLALFLSYAIGNPLDLTFEPLQLLALVLTAIIVPIVVSDGESTWIEGLQLLALYALIAIGFWY
jgi:Ca2+:H+ antiporter